MLIKKNLQYLHHQLVIVLFFTALTSCGAITDVINENKQSKQEKNEIRIVDLDGNARPVKRYVPEFNARVIAKRNLELDEGYKGDANNEVAVPNINVLDKEPSHVASVQDAAIQTSDSRKPAEVEYDLSSSSKLTEEAPVAASSPVVPAPVVVERTKKKGFKVVNSKSNKEDSKTWKVFVQIGSYSSLKSAESVLNKDKAGFSGEIQESAIKDKKIYRVLLGPFDGHRKASDSLKKIIKSGHKDAFIVKSK